MLNSDDIEKKSFVFISCILLFNWLHSNISLKTMIFIKIKYFYVYILFK